MTTGHGIITTLLRSIRQVKGPHGRVKLHAIHWRPDAPDARGIIAAGSRGIVPAGTLDTPPVQWDGTLHIGESVEFTGASPVTGYLHLFNLGTSGTCVKLCPSREYPANAVEAGQQFAIPSKQRLDGERPPDGAFNVSGPPSSQAGHPERLLAIVTVDDTDLQIEDLHPRLVGRDLLTRVAARGPSFSGPPRVGTAKLFRIPPDRWHYALLEMEVAAQ